MPGADKTATYGVKVDSNAKEVGNEGAAALEKLRTSIQGSQQSIREMSAAMKSLRGASDEVKGAKAQLQARIEAERSSMSANNLALLKAGSSYEKLSAQTKAHAAQQKFLAEAYEKSKAQWERLQLDKAKKQSEELGKSFDAQKAAILGIYGAIAGFAFGIGAALAHATTSFLQWLAVTGLAERKALLLREAWTGSASSAVALGHQIDALSGKVATSREELGALAGEVTRALSGTMVSGQGIVDTFNAIGQAAAAMGDTAGAKIREIVERSKQFGRVQINPFELQGTGITRGDVAAQLAKRLGVSIAAATTALAQGRVKVDDAAAALRAAIEKRFGEINTKLRLGDVLGNLEKRLQQLATGINFDPLLKGFERLSKLFDQSTVSGSILKTLIDETAKGIGPAFEAAVPLVEKAIKKIEILALRIGIAALAAKVRIKEAFSKTDTAGLEQLEERLQSVLPSVQALGQTALFTAQVFATSTVMAGKFASALERILEAREKLTKGGWSDVGSNIVSGIEKGITTALGSLKNAVGGLADTIKAAFREALGIASPSKVFEQYGKDTAAGYEKGVDKGAGSAQRAAEALAPKAPAAGAPGAAGGAGGAPTVHVAIDARGADAKAVERMQSATFLAQLTKAIQDALVTSGRPVQQEPQT